MACAKNQDEVIPMDYMSEYKRWLENPALSDEERAELKAVEGNKE